ncbi:MAG: ATP-binding protein [Desulfuromonadales bacterium]
MNSTEKRILVFAFLVLTLTVAVNTAFNVLSFRSMYRKDLIVRSNALATGLQSLLESDLRRGLPLKDLPELDRYCRQILQNDERFAYCLIEDDRGAPVFSSDPLLAVERAEPVPSPSANTVQREFLHLGRVFETSQAIYDGDNLLRGRVRIGFPESVLKVHAEPLLHQSLLVLVCASLGVFVLVIFFTKRDLVGPLKRLRRVAKEIADGNFQVDIPSMSTREFAEFAVVLREMSRSLQVRDEAVGNGYRELERTNFLLQEAYDQQEKTSSELSRSQKMHRALFENASDAIVISDHEERVLLLNKRAEIFFGISREQVLGGNLFDFISRMRGDRLALQNLYEQLLGQGRIESEMTFDPTGESQPLVAWISASVIRERKGNFWVQTILRDITQEARTKENLEQSTRDLQRLNRMKDSFLGLASHELKTPLTVIVGYSDLLLQDVLSPAEEPACTMVRHIADAAERLSGIVHDMVDVSLLDRHRLPMELVETETNSLIQQVTAEVENRLEQRRQRISLHLQDDLPKIECDPKRLMQAFDNLLGNAIKFTPDGGCINIETRLFEAAGGENRVEVLIGDTGIGIAKTEHEHIFEKFYEVGQIEEHFTAKVAFRGKGTGLGLSIAKGIIEMHGGRIWVESPGYDPQTCPGSVFHVLLPLRPPVASAA